LAFVRQGTGATSFISDHFNDLDGSNVYGLYSNKFYRFVGTGDNRKQTQVDGLYLCTNVGLYAVCTGNASSRGEYASILVGREMFGSNPNTVVVTTPNGNTLTVPVKYYKIFQSPRPKSVPLIILSSNGVYTVRNWRWCDPDNSQEDLKDFVDKFFIKLFKLFLLEKHYIKFLLEQTRVFIEVLMRLRHLKNARE
jgi:hypothetical protein